MAETRLLSRLFFPVMSAAYIRSMAGKLGGDAGHQFTPTRFGEELAQLRKLVAPTAA